MATSLLKITNLELLHRFLHYCIDELITKSDCDFNIGSEDIEWTKEDQIRAINFIQNLYRENILNKSEEFSLINKDINSKFQQMIRECYEIRKDQIFQAVLCEELHQPENNLVENVDWKLKWIMGSSKLATLREPLLQLDLHCFKKDNESTRKTLNFEFDLDQVNLLISDLENVQRLIRN